MAKHHIVVIGQGAAGIEAALQIGDQALGDWRGMHAEPVDARSTASAPIVLVYPYGMLRALVYGRIAGDHAASAL